ncbi:hypothetical protein D9M71_321670 [compost metagenome]
MPGRGDQGDAGRQAIGTETGRQGQRGEVGEVGEVGVGAELAVEQHRLLGHLGDGADGRRRRHYQCVEAGQALIDLPRQFGAQVFGLVGVGGAVVQALGDDAAHHWVDGLGVGVQHAFGGHGALGNPGALIELLGQFAEWREVDGGNLGA